MMIMPVVFTVICVNLPSGLVLYWFVNNVLGIGQQWLVNRHTGRLEAEHTAVGTPAKGKAGVAKIPEEGKPAKVAKVAKPTKPARHPKQGKRQQGGRKRKVAR
jgi:membrane protein insertase Oxa1/YidC/SpoIIIJ